MLAVDAASALLALAVAGFFARLGHRLDVRTYVLFGVGFAIVGATFLGITASEEARQAGESSVWSAIRLAGQLGGALVILFAYLGARGPGGPKTWTVAGGATAVVTVAMMASWLVFRDATTFGWAEAALPAQQAATAAIYLACAVLASAGFRHAPRVERALPPTGFLLLAAAKLTWLLGAAQDAVPPGPVAYPARLLGLALLLGGVLWPTGATRAGGADAPS